MKNKTKGSEYPHYLTTSNTADSNSLPASWDAPAIFLPQLYAAHPCVNPQRPLFASPGIWVSPSWCELQYQHTHFFLGVHSDCWANLSSIFFQKAKERLFMSGDMRPGNGLESQLARLFYIPIFSKSLFLVPFNTVYPFTSNRTSRTVLSVAHGVSLESMKTRIFLNWVFVPPCL